MLKSKLIVSILLIIIIVCLSLTFTFRSEWWCFIDIFFFFMAAFIQLMALTLGAKIPYAGRLFYKIASIFAILGIIALIGEAIAWYYIL